LEPCNRSCAESFQSNVVRTSTPRRSFQPAALAAALIVMMGLLCNPAHAQSMYGPGLNSDALDNIPIGPNQTKVSYRFMAMHTGKVSKLHLFLITDGSHAGYNAGNGGELLIQIQTDDGSSAHNPSGTTLASYQINEPNNDFPILSFSSQPTLEEGHLYHIVFTNVASSPSENYVSLDDLYMSPALNPMQPTMSNEECAVLTHSEYESWNVFSNDTPVYQLDYTDGTTTGIGYMEVWVNAPQVIGGTHAVREAFTVSGSERVVSKFSIRVARTTGSAPLTVRLENANGNLIEQGTIPSADVPESSSSNPQYYWVTYTFSALRTLFEGDAYHVDLEASSGTSYQTFPIRKGSKESFSTSTFFPDGYAQFKNGASWVGWTEWGQTNRTDGDLQFYFTVVP
jgi:hypothetical protein